MTPQNQPNQVPDGNSLALDIALFVTGIVLCAALIVLLAYSL